MAKIEITKTELVWPGKYNEDGTRREAPRANLPFQVIETINESRATREAKKEKNRDTLFDVYQGKEGDTFEDGWRNKLIWGDNLLVMGSLLEKFAGKIDLIYIDPPFATGADFGFRTHIGETQLEAEKDQSVLEEKAYRDTWGRGMTSYLTMMDDRLRSMRELLSERGSIFVHCDWRVSGHLRFVLDEMLSPANFRNEVIWKRTGARSGTVGFNIIHDSIFFYTKGENPVWNTLHTPYSEEYVEGFFRDADSDGRRYQSVTLTAPGIRKGVSGKAWRGVDPTVKGRHWSIPRFIRPILSDPETEDIHRALDELESKGRILWPDKKGGVPRFKQFLDEMEGVELQSIWADISPIASQANERLNYDTQKPEALLERIISASSLEGALVADFFCGSGTTLGVAEKLGRRWIGCDLSRWAIHVSRKRLLELEGCKPFEVLNLGKYERKYWQGVTFGGPPAAGAARAGKKKDDSASGGLAIFQYIAFILKLYEAEPLAGMEHLHGKKAKAVVHVGAVDAPVTIDEINACIEECLNVRQKELHVLAWEWEMGLANLMVQDAKRRGIKLLLLNIPREVMEQQAVDKGDIRFFEVAHLELETRLDKGRKVTVNLKDFAFPYADLIPDEVRSKIRKWSDYIDYWAVDWNFQNDTFMQGWVTYRTRKDRSLALKSDAHAYEKAGRYNVMVKVIDIFGNDTSQVFEVSVS